MISEMRHRVNLVDTTDSISIGSANSDISIVSPTISPRVLDKIMISGETDSENSMVNLGSAISLDDSALVESEGSIASSNGEGNWLFSDSSC